MESYTLHQQSQSHLLDSSQERIKSPSSPERKAGRRKISIEYIDDKSRRHITFSKRKAGIMKKAYELSTLTGTQVLLLVASETGHVYTFATPKLQPLITKPSGKNLIQSCLNATDPASVSVMQQNNNNNNRPPYSPSPDSPIYTGNSDYYPEEKPTLKTEMKPYLGNPLPHLPPQYMQQQYPLPVQDSNFPGSSIANSPSPGHPSLASPSLPDGSRYPYSFPQVPPLGGRYPATTSYPSSPSPSGYQPYPSSPSASPHWPSLRPPLKMPLQNLDRAYPSLSSLSNPSKPNL